MFSFAHAAWLKTACDHTALEEADSTHGDASLCGAGMLSRDAFPGCLPRMPSRDAAPRSRQAPLPAELPQVALAAAPSGATQNELSAPSSTWPSLLLSVSGEG